MSVVKLERDIMLGPSFGHRGAPNSCITYKIQPRLHQCLWRNIIIPNEKRLTPQAFASDKNLCVPLAVILKLDSTQHPHKHKITKTNISLALSSLRYQELRTKENNFKILRSDFRKFEELNTPFHPQLLQLYPFLRVYSGFALNSYRCTHVLDNGKARFINTQLSQHWNNSQFFQIDLLESDIVLSPPVTDHVIPIKNWSRFASHHTKVGNYTNACRSCFRLFKKDKQASYKTHILKRCTSKATDQRLPRNHIIHRAFIKNKRTGERRRHVVAFHPKNYHSTFQTLVYGTMDFEATSKKAIPGLLDPKTPSSTIMFQKPFAVSLCYVTPYNIPLPQNLTDIVIKFFDERDTTLNEFYLSILLTLRQNVKDINKFIIDTLSTDKGPPNLSSLNDKDRIAYLEAQNCSFCNIKFGTKLPSKKDSRFFYTVKKTRHHDHFIQIPNLAKRGFRPNLDDDDLHALDDEKHKVIVLCSNCNLSTRQDGFLPRTSLRILLHNGGKYDFCFVSDMLARVGHAKFSQIDENGQVLETPLIKGMPDILCKDKNNIITIKTRFNCDQRISCPYHSSAARLNNNKYKQCPNEKEIVFSDSAMMMTTSVDAMLQDVNKIHEGKKDPRLVFPRTYHFITRQMKYGEEVFHSVLNKKIPQPFEMIDSLQYALDMKQPPPLSHFFSNLKGDNITGKPSVSAEDYSNFKDIWHKINAQSYFDLLKLYSGADSTILADVLSFYYGYIYAVSGLDAIQFPTSASFSLQSALFNSKSPYNNNKRLKLQVPSKKIAKIYALGLRGGYAFVNANLCEFRHLETEQTNSVPPEFIKQVSFEDLNGLYSSLLRQRIIIGHYLLYSKRHNRKDFDMLSQRLLDMDIDFFANQMLENNFVYFFVVVLSYDDDALFAKQNIDLSFFPFYESVSLDQLSTHQRERAGRLKRDPASEGAKLVSYLKRDLRTADFVENIIYQMAIHHASVGRIIKIVRAKAYPVFNPWISRLEEEKRHNVSPILNRLWKSFGNNVCGKVGLSDE